MKEASSKTQATPDLFIRFTGLCLFVPNYLPGQVDVLLLNVTDPRMERHFVQLQALTCDPPCGCSAGYGPPINVPAFLDLSDIGTVDSSSTAVLTADIADITAATGGRLDDTAVRSVGAGTNVAARVRLPSGSCGIYTGGRWNFGGHNRELAFCVNWQITSPDMNKLLQKLTPPNGPPPTIPLVDGAHKLLMVNVTKDELPNAANTGFPIPWGLLAPHFTTFYNVVTPKTKRVIPSWDDDPTSIKPGPACPGQPVPKGLLNLFGSFVRCMVAQVSP